MEWRERSNNSIRFRKKRAGKGNLFAHHTSEVASVIRIVGAVAVVVVANNGGHKSKEKIPFNFPTRNSSREVAQNSKTKNQPCWVRDQSLPP
jgi:hypothetical protein